MALEENGTDEEPRYSCFFERRYEDDSYRITGAQFLWHRSKKSLTFESMMGSIYHNPVAPIGAGGSHDETRTKRVPGDQPRDSGR